MSDTKYSLAIFLLIAVAGFDIDSSMHSQISSAASAWSMQNIMQSPIFDRSGVMCRMRSSSRSRWLQNRKFKHQFLVFHTNATGLITPSTMCPCGFRAHLCPRWAPRACLGCKNSTAVASRSNRLWTCGILSDSIRWVCRPVAARTTSNDSKCVLDSRFRTKIYKKISGL